MAERGLRGQGKEEARSVFFDEDVRRPDCGLYPVHKRLQEEMCRQFYEGHGELAVRWWHAGCKG